MNQELRTPLNAILGFAEMIRDRAMGDDAIDTYAEYAGHIHASGLSLRTLVEDILEFARIDANKMQIEPAPLDLRTVVEDVAGMMDPAVRNAGLTLRVELGGGVPPAMADRRAVRLILVNLVSNALRHTPSGGTITVRHHRDGRRWPCLTVADDGPGVSEETRKTLFLPFALSGPADVAQKSGPGIGLYVVKALVEKHGGTIELDSEPGRGTVVTVGLPRAETG